ncbi:MAG TPA: type IX secretion system membrane protein PorP/SprF [Cyclobacteriaceae bacterium]
MKKLVLIALANLTLFSFSFGQQDPLYSQYINNPMVINPAYAGLNNNLNASLSYRSQWGGFEGNPTTVNINGHISLVDNRVGTGILVVQDKIGNVTNTEFQVAGSYKLQLEDATFSFGMQAGVINFKSDFSKLNLADGGDPAFTGNENLSKPNIGAGVALKSERYFVGLSVPRLLSTTFKSSMGEQFDLYNQHFYLFGAYVFNMGTRIRLKPSVLFKSVKGSPLSTDLNFNLNIDQLYSAGIFTRNFNTYGLQVTALLKDQFRFGYTFEIPTANSVGTQFNTHELMLGIKMAVLTFHERSISNF